MPRKKKVPGDAVKTTATVPLALHREVTQELSNVGLNFSLAEAINEGLAMWLTWRKAILKDNLLAQQLEKATSANRIKYLTSSGEADGKSDKKTPGQGTRHRAAG